MLPIKVRLLFSFFLNKGEESIICSCRCAYIHTDTNKEKGDAFLSCSPQGRQHSKSLCGVSSKNSPLPKSGLYKFSPWDRLKQEALCNTLCLGTMSALRHHETLRAACQLQKTKVAVLDTSPWDAHEQLNGSFSLSYTLPALRDRVEKQIYPKPLVWRDFLFILFLFLLLNEASFVSEWKGNSLNRMLRRTLISFPTYKHFP